MTSAEYPNRNIIQEYLKDIAEFLLRHQKEMLSSVEVRNSINSTITMEDFHIILWYLLKCLYIERVYGQWYTVNPPEIALEKRLAKYGYDKTVFNTNDDEGIVNV